MTQFYDKTAKTPGIDVLFKTHVAAASDGAMRIVQ